MPPASVIVPVLSTDPGLFVTVWLMLPTEIGADKGVVSAMLVIATEALAPVALMATELAMPLSAPAVIDTLVLVMTPVLIDVCVMPSAEKAEGERLRAQDARHRDARGGARCARPRRSPCARDIADRDAGRGRVADGGDAGRGLVDQSTAGQRLSRR
jgi:hypothetical protein